MRSLIYLKYYGQRISFGVVFVSFILGVCLDNSYLLLVASISALICVGFFKLKIEY
jgi:hypothetical protein